MAHRLLVVPGGHAVGLTSVCLGLLRALDRLGIRYAFVKPIDLKRQDPQDPRVDRSSALVRLTTPIHPPQPIARHAAEALLGEGREAELLEQVVALVEKASHEAEVVVVEGLVPGANGLYASQLNVAMAKALDAELVMVASPGAYHASKTADYVDIAARAYGSLPRQGCCILNMVRGLTDKAADSSATIGGAPGIPVTRVEGAGSYREALTAEGLFPLGIIPYAPELAAPRMKELATAVEARTLNQGDWLQRRVHSVALCAATVGHALEHFNPGTLIITPGDREDMLLAAALAELEGAQLAGVLLTGGRMPNERVLSLCRRAMRAGLVVLLANGDSYTTATQVRAMPRDVPADDKPRAELVMNFIASHIDGKWLQRLASVTQTQRMTTPAFRHRLIERARAAKRVVVLPEGSEPRTIKAAAICAERGIASPVLLGDPESIRSAARNQGIQLPDSIRILSPKQEKHRFIQPMVELRKHKGLTEAIASDQLEDTVVLGTMMLQQGEVHGLVSGAIHTTANTIRPALQLIRTAPNTSIVSSVFFMCLPEQVLVYGDCAVNPNPNAQQLAEIALQSASSAAAFGIEPRVAMISYSTGTSGSGAEVDKVAQATRVAQQLAPDLLIDGPLQYDAAAIADVGHKKAPDSPVAGRATVFVFPDLNTGNTTYKAVQRSANVVSMGPMLQGLAKPVNDLSRGALVEDIVFTIALTAIQAAALNNAPLSQ